MLGGYMETIFEKHFTEYLAARWQSTNTVYFYYFSLIFPTSAFLSNLQHITNAKFQENVLQKTFQDIY